jgi:hypothetical protein
MTRGGRRGRRPGHRRVSLLRPAGRKLCGEAIPVDGRFLSYTLRELVGVMDGIVS